MPKESKYSWNDMFKLDTVNSEEQSETTEETSTTAATEEVEDTIIGSQTVEIEERDEEETEEEDEVEETVAEKKVVKPKPAAPAKEVEDPSGVFSPFMGLITEGVLSFDETKEYENSPEGVKELLQDNIKTGVEAWKNQYPTEALEVLEHIKNGGSLRELIQIEQDGPDYEKDVDLTDINHQKYVLEDWFTEQGFEPDEIKAKLEKYEEAGLIEEEAKTAHKRLIATHKKKKEILIETQRKETERKQAEFRTKTESFKKKVLETKDVAGFQLKPGEQQVLLDYMTKPVKEGKTQLQLEYDEDAQLKMAYFMMKKFDFKEVEKKATTKASIKLKEAVSRANDTNLKTKGTVVPKEEKEDESSTDIYGLPWQTNIKKK